MENEYLFVGCSFFLCYTEGVHKNAKRLIINKIVKRFLIY